MERLPEAGTPEYEQRMERARDRLMKRPSLGHRLIGYAFVLVMMIFPAIYLIAQACRHETSTFERWTSLGAAIILLLVPGRIFHLTVRRRLKTGAWSLRPTPEERIETARRWVARQTPQRTKRMANILWALDLVCLPMYLLVVWSTLRPHHRPLDGSDYFIAVTFSVLALRSAWGLYRKSRDKLTSAA